MQLKLHGLLINLPDGWKKDKSGAVINTTVPQAPMTLVLEREAVGSDVDAHSYATSVRQLLEKEFDTYEIFEEGPWDVAGVPGIFRQHAFAFQGQDIGQIQLYFVRDRHAYSLTLGYPGRAYENGMESAERVFEALEFM